MKYKMFLMETEKHTLDEPSYKKVITEDEAIKLIKSHCKNVDFKKPLYRGMKAYGRSQEFLSMEGQKGSRKSSETSNHYTLIIDHLLKQNYRSAPLRGASLICTNDKSYAGNYGKEYALFPYDDVEIGKCDEEDIWGYRVSIGDGSVSDKIADVNDYFSEVVDNPKSYEDIVNQLAKFLDDEENEKSKGSMIRNLYVAFKSDWEDRGMDEDGEWSEADKKDVVEGALEGAYSPDSNFNMEFGTYKELEIDELDTHHEFWFGGKCVAIEYNTYKQMIDDGMFE